MERKEVIHNLERYILFSKRIIFATCNSDVEQKTMIESLNVAIFELKQIEINQELFRQVIMEKDDRIALLENCLKTLKSQLIDGGSKHDSVIVRSIDSVINS